MQESEFRDWARRAFGTYEERLRRLEERPVASVAGEELGPSLGKTFAEMVEELNAALRAGVVRGLAIAFVREGGGSNLGFAASDRGYLRLAGVAQVLAATIVAEFVKFQEAAGAASGETDEGRPEARGPKGIGPSEVEASAPAGGA